jgi:hypothetical protein
MRESAETEVEHTERFVFSHPCTGEISMATKVIKEFKIERPARARLSAKESLKRMQGFSKRREKFIAAIRKGKD